MSLKATIQSDIATIFTDLDSSPHATTAVYTPVGGSAQPSINGLFTDTPLRGDPYQEREVDEADTVFMAKASDVSSWKGEGNVYIGNNSTNYKIVNAPFPKPGSNYWSIIWLRLPLGRETRI